MSADVIVAGAGIVGAATAYFAARAGLEVLVVERSGIGAGTSSHGEGNILVSDKEAGPELDLALYSNAIWRGELAEFAQLWEFQAKGGVVVARSEAGQRALEQRVGAQRRSGMTVDVIRGDELLDVEPYASRELVGGAWYPQDAQVQPVLATHHLLRLARQFGARVLTGTRVTGFLTAGGRASGVRTPSGDLPGGAVVNCTGPWGGELAALAGIDLPVAPRRGYVLVTEPIPATIRHKVYAAEYVGDVSSGDAALQTSPVVEGTPSGTVLIGSSRERVGFDSTVSVAALGAIAASAIQLFPALAGVAVLRCYWGYRPYCPDHLPIIGEDARLPGLWHAVGHEGAGIGLAVGTGKLLAQALAGRQPDLDLRPFRPDRFEETASAPDGADAPHGGGGAAPDNGRGQS